MKKAKLLSSLFIADITRTNSTWWSCNLLRPQAVVPARSALPPGTNCSSQNVPFCQLLAGPLPTLPLLFLKYHHLCEVFLLFTDKLTVFCICSSYVFLLFLFARIATNICWIDHLPFHVSNCLSLVTCIHILSRCESCGCSFNKEPLHLEGRAKSWTFDTPKDFCEFCAAG